MPAAAQRGSARHGLCGSFSSRGETSILRRSVMNWDTMKGDWKRTKGKIREKWGELTDDELDQVQGRREQFEGLLQKKFGMAKDEVKRQVDDFEKSCHC